MSEVYGKILMKLPQLKWLIFRMSTLIWPLQFCFLYGIKKTQAFIYHPFKVVPTTWLHFDSFLSDIIDGYINNTCFSYDIFQSVSGQYMLFSYSMTCREVPCLQQKNLLSSYLIWLYIVPEYIVELYRELYSCLGEEEEKKSSTRADLLKIWQ